MTLDIREERKSGFMLSTMILSLSGLEHIYTLQSENIDNLIYLPKGSSLKTFTIEQLKQVRDQFVDYVNSLIGDKLYEDLEG